MHTKSDHHGKSGGNDGSDEEEPLVDMTQALSLRSKRTERQKRRLQKKQKRAAEAANLLSLPVELLVQILQNLRPSDCFQLACVCRGLNQLVAHHGEAVAKHLIGHRYASLAKCFPRPVLLRNVEPTYYPALRSHRRQKMLEIQKKPYQQHIKPADPEHICSCMTCVLAWNNLNLLVDLAHWQNQLDRREPLPIIERGTNPAWNVYLVLENSKVVDKAIESSLGYALILQRHLNTTVRTITRYRRYGKTIPYDMTKEDAESGTDSWLERKGQPSYEFPFRRDMYYYLEAYLPNRKYDKTLQKWMYYQGSQHDRDLEWAFNNFSKPQVEPTQEAQQPIMAVHDT